MSKWSQIRNAKRDKAILENELLRAQTSEEWNEIHLQLNELEQYLNELFAIDDELEQWQGGDY